MTILIKKFEYSGYNFAHNIRIFGWVTSIFYSHTVLLYGFTYSVGKSTYKTIFCVNLSVISEQLHIVKKLIGSEIYFIILIANLKAFID